MSNGGKKQLKYAIRLLMALIFLLFPLGFIRSAASPDAIAVRVMPNEKNYSALRWYKEQKFLGSPQNLTVDGYEAVRDGRTVYVNAANIDGNDFFTNIYIISYNQQAENRTTDIFGQLLAHWKFNANIKAKETDKCRLDTAKTCQADADCAVQSGDYCLSQKAKIIRDTKRLADLADMNLAMVNYKNDIFPRLPSGSYMAGVSVSTWPSWQATLSQELGVTLPLDPVNRLGNCPDFEEKTCWNQSSKSFYFNFIDGDSKSISNSLVYWYKNGQFNINLETSADYSNLKNIKGVNFASLNSALNFEPALKDINLKSGEEYNYQIRVKDPKLTNANQYNLDWSLADDFGGFIAIKPLSAKNLAEIKIKSKIITPLSINYDISNNKTINIHTLSAMPDSFLFTYKCSSPYYTPQSWKTNSYFGSINFTFYFVDDTAYSSHPSDSSLCDGQQHEIEISNNKKLSSISLRAPSCTLYGTDLDIKNCLKLENISFYEFKKISGERAVTVNVLDKNTNKSLIGDFKINIYECGNGTVDPGEVCDINKTVANGQCCESGAYYGNSGVGAIYTIGCRVQPSCSFVVCDSSGGYSWNNETKSCYKHCGDNALNYGEECDYDSSKNINFGLTGWDCAPGTLSCDKCRRICFMGGNPYQGKCGNGIIEGSEVCDGDTNTPANARCQANCSKWECNSTSHSEGNLCLSNTRENHASCLISGVTKATQVWDPGLNSGSGGWGACQAKECNTGNGYYLDGGTCKKNITCDSANGYHLNYDGKSCTNLYEAVCSLEEVKNGDMKSTYLDGIGWGACEMKSRDFANYPYCLENLPQYPGQKVCVNACGSIIDNILLSDQLFTSGYSNCYIQNATVNITYYSGQAAGSTPSDAYGKIAMGLPPSMIIKNNKCAFIYSINAAGASATGSGCPANPTITAPAPICVKIDKSNPYNWNINSMPPPPSSSFDPVTANCFN